ncbi:MAG: hydantoinase/oxoprolinase family protein [Gammaproteobacteria bacterium]
MSAASDCVVGWDIGGAHLKAVAIDATRRLRACRILPCPLWQGMERLEQAFAAALAALPVTPRAHALTMTGEGCDLFADRAEGVARILDTAARALAPQGWRVYADDGGLVARAAPARIASMNWHATGRALGAVLPDALLVDLGSTTADVTLVRDGEVRTIGRDDRERLARDELVYQGIARTPVMALAQRVPYRGAWQGMAAEYFATMADVYRVLGELPEGADLMPSADGRPKTARDSAARLARMVGDDFDATREAAVVELAAWLRSAQLARLRAAVLRVCAESPARVVVGAGVGRFLVRELAISLGLAYRDYAEALGIAEAEAANDCAPALALACLELGA